MLPTEGVIQIEKTVRNLTLTLAGVSNNSICNLHKIYNTLNSLEDSVMDNLIALDLFAGPGGLCAITNTACCTRVNDADKVGKPRFCLKKKLFGSLM